MTLKETAPGAPNKRFSIGVISVYTPFLLSLQCPVS